MDDKTDLNRIERDPESADAVLTGRTGLPRPEAAAADVDPAADELKEAGVAPIGVAAVDVIATSPESSAEPVTARWALSDAEIRAVILGVCLSMFLAALNQTSIATALPTIGRDFRDFENLSWLITSYLLTSTIAAPLSGKLSDIYGRRLVMLLVLGLFIIGSIACALAPNMITLILMRALQGIGGGGIMPLVQATVADAIAPRERGRYQAYIGIVWMTAGVIGPFAGGFVADHWHWSVLFWLNVPLGLAAAFTINRQLKRLPANYRKHKLDWFGALLMTLAAVLALLALSWGGVRYSWFSSTIILLIACAAALTLAFAYRLAHEPEPFLPLAILANPVVRMGTLSASSTMAVSIGLTVFIPLYYESVHHLSAANSGLALIPIAIMSTPGAIMSGRVMMHFDHYKWFPLLGLATSTIGLLVLTIWPAAPLWIVIIALCLFGVGTGSVFSCTTVCIQNSVSRFHVGTAIGVLNFFRALASSLVVAIFGAILLWGVGHGAEGGNRAIDVLSHAGASAPVDLAGVFRWVFVAGVALMLLAIVAFALMEERPLRGRSEVGGKN